MKTSNCFHFYSAPVFCLHLGQLTAAELSIYFPTLCLCELDLSVTVHLPKQLEKVTLTVGCQRQGQSHFTPAKRQPTHRFFSLHQGGGATKTPRQWLIQRGRSKRLSAGTLWTLSSLFSLVNPEGIVQACYLLSPHLRHQAAVARRHLITSLMSAVSRCSEVSQSTSLEALKVNASPRRSLLNFACILKEARAFHACGNL